MRNMQIHHWWLLPIVLSLFACEPPRDEQAPPGAPRNTGLPGEVGIPGTGEPQHEAVVDVALREFRIDMPATLPPGPTTFRITNDGQMHHSFELLGPTGRVGLSQPLQPGQSEMLNVELLPGEYQVNCPVEDHPGRGMTRHLAVGEHLVERELHDPREHREGQDVPIPR